MGLKLEIRLSAYTPKKEQRTAGMPNEIIIDRFAYFPVSISLKIL